VLIGGLSRETPTMSPSRAVFASAILLLPLLGYPGPAHPETQAFADLLQGMKEKFDKIQDYQCIYDSSSFHDGKTQRLIFNYFFRKPKLIRIEILEGRHPGAVLIYDSHRSPTQVRVDLGGGVLAVLQQLKGKYYFDLEDRRLMDLRGRSIDQSDWGWLIDRHLETIQSMDSTFEGEEVLLGRKILIYTLVSKDPGKTMSVDKETLWIDKQDLVPVQCIQYDGSGRMLRSTLYREIKINANLGEGLFAELDQSRHESAPLTNVKPPMIDGR
jgi:outer membrane lipoprotein-sorting protein